MTTTDPRQNGGAGPLSPNDQGPASTHQKGTNTMTAQPVTEATARFIPATVDVGLPHVIGSKTNTVLLDTVTGQHVCPQCDYTAPRFVQVRSHLGAHSTKERKPRGKQQQAPDLVARIDQIAELLIEVRTEFQALNETTGKVDAEWKSRAMKAERRLSSLRRALGGDAS